MVFFNMLAVNAQSMGILLLFVLIIQVSESILILTVFVSNYRSWYFMVELVHHIKVNQNFLRIIIQLL